ncbi:MAG: adenylate/guanylate cyclase domain-containing protein [Spirochaetia bacterium]|jgi:class 3 adenylate cyclase
MKTFQRSKLGFHIAEAAYAVILLLWYALPFIDSNLGGFDPRQLPGILFGSPPTQVGAWVLVTVLVYLVPVLCLWKIASIFLSEILPIVSDPEWLFPIIFNILSSGIVVALIILHLVNKASNASYFAAFPPVTYAVAALSLGYNGFFIVMLIMSWSKRDVSYKEYLEFRRTGEDRRGISPALQRVGIQRKLMLTFVPLILVIILVLAFFLLRDFSSTIFAAVKTNGEGLAERTASVVKASPGDRIALDDYFRAEAKKNVAAAGQSSYRFNTLSFYGKDAKAGGFQIWASTDEKLLNQRVAQTEASPSQTINRYNAEKKTYEFLTPVILSNVSIGYVMVDYARDVIYEPLFRTQVRVFVIAALFMYAAVFLIYLFGRGIVFPILFLRMSVNSIANVLSSMVKGKLRFSSELLQYKDRVRTQDEIKLLSGEVSHMTTVIRGVIPYISQSTLQAAERDSPTTESKELSFLFTDIRGFTTLCEGMEPDKVVELLNHYLDIQASLIAANEGDVDKYVGDEMMAQFDGPRKELNACKAGLEIRRAMAEEARKATDAAGTVIDIGIGINTGQVVHGSVGAKDRMDFTSIGDTVNLAARLEGANKQYGTGSLITEAVYEKVEEEFLCREIDLLTVKGKKLPVRIFEIIREKKGATERDERFKKLFETSLGLYRKQKWDAAEKGFSSLAKDYNDETSEVFLKRIELFRKDPPPKGWDGVFNLTVK